MTKRMLIDASHAEETRVVMLDGNRLEDYDVETASKKQLKGNIYLAKIVRVEPSLQAAFVEYGGNRHGFLAFGEIHPDYFQIPVADRQRLLALQEEEAEAERVAEEQDRDRAPRRGARDERDETTADDEGEEARGEGGRRNGIHRDESQGDEAQGDEAQGDEAQGDEGQGDEGEAQEEPETLGGSDESGSENSGERARRAAARLMRHYKIQEVIRRRQIVLVQVVKEERGTKGAALTTYISLAGRYCVLMPNSPRGGGVSRKITSAADRKRLKEITAELDIPKGMAMIVRTAGAQRPRPEIKRDCEYLLRLWDEIRDTTMQSTAPALIYEEASLIKRAIRDVYSSDVDEILVDGEEGWRAARGFMRTLMPSHARKVQLWRESQPLFARSNVEGFLDAMLNPTVQLRSGGYLVINQTEALVAIDVNSGRSTRERGIEETALRTNLEAADEVARQLRLRDLAGLIVIDFIDMESRKHNGMVERRLKEALRQDRARIQVGSISHFGLLEMSRQRLRPSLAENSFTPCPHCNGTGLVRGTESSALHVLRAIEAVGTAGDAAEIAVHVAGPIALYILNGKREWLAEIERRCQMQVRFEIDDSLQPPTHRIVRTQIRSPGELTAPLPSRAASVPEIVEAEIVEEEETVERSRPAASRPEKPGEKRAEAIGGETPPSRSEDDDEGGERRKKRRRRRRRGGKREDDEGVVEAAEGGEAAIDGEADAERAIAPGDGGMPGAGEPRAEGHTAAGGDAQAESDTPAESDIPSESDTGERSGRGRRGRRSGRRRREDRGVDVPIEQGPAPAYQAPAYQGPTPADPFVGTYDIFEALERSEEEAFVVNSAASGALLASIEPPARATPEHQEGREAGHEPRHEEAQQDTPEPPAREQAEDAAVAFARSEALVHEDAPEAQPEAESHEAGHAEATQDAAAPEEPQGGPAVQPILVGAEPVQQRRSGWWRR